MKMIITLLPLVLGFTLLTQTSQEGPSLECRECKKSTLPYTANKFVSDTAQGVFGAGLMLFALYTGLKSAENGLKVLGLHAAQGITGKMVDAAHQLGAGAMELVGAQPEAPKEPTLTEQLKAFEAQEMPALKTSAWGTLSVISFITGLKFLKRALYCN